MGAPVRMWKMAHELIGSFLIDPSGELGQKAHAIDLMLGGWGGVGGVQDRRKYIHHRSDLLMVEMVAGDLKGIALPSLCPAGNEGNPDSTFVAGSLFSTERGGAEIAISVSQRRVGSVVADEKHQGIFSHSLLYDVIHEVTQ